MRESDHVSITEIRRSELWYQENGFVAFLFFASSKALRSRACCSSSGVNVEAIPGVGVGAGARAGADSVTEPSGTGFEPIPFVPSDKGSTFSIASRTTRILAKIA